MDNLTSENRELANRIAEYLPRFRQAIAEELVDYAAKPSRDPEATAAREERKSASK